MYNVIFIIIAFSIVGIFNHLKKGNKPQISKAKSKTFTLDFKPLKEGGERAKLFFNTAQFNTLWVYIYKGSPHVHTFYGNKGMFVITIENKGKEIITIDEMTENDLLSLFNLISKL